MADKKQSDLAPEITQEMDQDLKEQLEQKIKYDVVIDVDEPTQDSKDDLLSSSRCIYKVPTLIRKINEDAYTPMAVSIGPFHHGVPSLHDMEDHKQVLFKRFKVKFKASLDEMVRMVEHLEPKVRASYSQNINLTKEQLVNLLLVDAAFIIELFTRNPKEGIDDAKLSQIYLRGTISRDLLLLENQLPFFLLEDLYNIAFPGNLHGHLPTFLNLTLIFFDSWSTQNLKLSPNDKIMHFTDLLRLFYLPRTKPKRNPFKPGDLLYSANELHEAGIKFKPIKNNCLLSLNFSGHILEIPQILVEDGTELMFRNMIALEHCHYPFDSYIIDYTMVMDHLINTRKDVDLLVHRKIIQNWLGDANEVATLFNGLGKNILSVNFGSEYLDICKRLNEFYHYPWHKMKATLRRDYCNTPWKTVATVVGIIVLVLSTTQTILSLLKAFK